MTRAVPPPSVYRALDEEAVVAPPLDQDRAASIAIIGGGIVGLSTALHLATSGVDVAVLEAEEIGWGASGNNGGQLNPGLKRDPDAISATFGPDLGEKLTAFAYSAPEATFALIHRHRIDCDARQNGTLRAATSVKAGQSVLATAEQCLSRGMPVEILDTDAVERLTGTRRYTLAMLDHRGGDLHPLKFTRGLAHAAAAAGARIYEKTSATRLRREGGAWRIVTPLASIRADKVLLATNGFTDDLWTGLKRSIVPVYSAIAATEPLSSNLSQAVVPFRGATYESGRITVYYRVDAEGRLLMGGRGPMRRVETASQLTYLTRYAVRLWPGLRDIAWPFAWNSRLAVTTDHWPHVHELAPGVMTYLGCNGRGIALGAAMGQELGRRLLDGDSYRLPFLVTHPKSIRFHAFWPVGVMGAVALGRIQDRLGL